MKRTILILCLVACLGAFSDTFAQKPENRIEKELSSKYGYLIAYQRTGEKLVIEKTENFETVQKIFESATGLNIGFNELINDYFFTFKNGQVEVWVQYGNLIYKKNGKVRFREFSREQRNELKALQM